MPSSPPTHPWLDRIEALGNRLPHPTLLFVWLCLLVPVISAVASGLGVIAVHPVTGETLEARNLISRYGLDQVLRHTVDNFTGFAPLGTVLVAMLGIGVAEHSGLISALLRRMVARLRGVALTASVVLAGVLSSLAADAGYVVLIPLAGLLFRAAGRAPLAGIAAAFAGVSGGFSANLLIGPIDAILAGLSTEAVRLIDTAYTVEATGNYYFIVASTGLITVLGTAVTARWVEPRLTAPANATSGDDAALSTGERRGLRAVGVFTLGVVAVLLWGLLPDDGLLRDADTGRVVGSPFLRGIVTLIALYAGLAGYLYGRVSGEYRQAADAIHGMEATMRTMAIYLVLMFFAAQFINYFAWTRLGTIVAIHGAGGLQALALPPWLLLLGFLAMTALVNLLIGSASAKWALLAPVFVPMLYLTGLSPEAVQMAFRVGDSATNIITPLMPYFPIVLAFAQQHEPRAGIGTLAALMLPYSLALLAGWSVLLLVWYGLDWPLGVAAPFLLTP